MKIGAVYPRDGVPSVQHQQLWKAAQAIEASFLSEMLKSTGLSNAPESFGGGIGEEQFSSLLVNEYGQTLAKTRGIGIAEAVFRTLSKEAVS